MQSIKSTVFTIKCYNNLNNTHVVCDVYNPENCLLAREQSYAVWCSLSTAVENAYPAIEDYMKLSNQNNLVPILELQYTKCVANDVTKHNNISSNLEPCATDDYESVTNRMFTIIIEENDQKFIPFDKTHKYKVLNPEGYLLKLGTRWSPDICVVVALSSTFACMLSYVQLKCDNKPALIKIVVVNKKTEVEANNETKKFDTHLNEIDEVD